LFVTLEADAIGTFLADSPFYETVSKASKLFCHRSFMVVGGVQTETTSQTVLRGGVVDAVE
jgi:hypothetical protein